ncbi:phosphoribosylglycinamide formyltransferase [Lophiostoma macrostomum CBS 122681]|uniref:phosphoribosylglycinamide formyltransferase 1 n=1 Tax=Lophiostoma macrostomum CBS 122681 TaxID=1314788 RepID=A0A6A6TD81_9PLEO|nr:phosphoribosylglycinamide formyltransferase [Lophiostoma macrostomum CBS 122681]
MPDPTFNLTVLISGNGSNLQALIDACAGGKLPNARVTHVISNRKAAYGLERARRAHIPTTYHNLVPYKKAHPDSIDAAREAYDADLASLILKPGTSTSTSTAPDTTPSSSTTDPTHPTNDKNPTISQQPPIPHLIICAGWMHILSPSFLNPLSQSSIPVINLHPALPGTFAGAGAIERAWEAARTERLDKTGVMVHEMIAEVDAGDAVVVAEVELPRNEDGVYAESLEELENRVHKVEHGLIVEGARRVLERIRGESAGK